MQILINYIIECLKPKNENEFIVIDKFDIYLFDNLIQDGFMITKTKPPDNIQYMEYIQFDDYYFIKKVYKNVDFFNEEDGSLTFSNNSEPLYRRLLPEDCTSRGLETINHTFIIKTIINYINKNKTNKGTYIEYGVRDAQTLNDIVDIVDIAYGVDIVNEHKHNDKCLFYQEYTNDFSKNKLPNINFDFAFIDADHKFESVIEDFRNIYKYIQSGGYIFLHDTYPSSLGLLDPGFCNNCFLTPIVIKKEFPNIEILTLPINPGLTIIRKK